MVNSVLIYASIALITSLFSELSVKVKNKWIRGFCLLLTLFIPSFFAGVRYGIGTDYFAYERIFNNLKCGYEVRTEFGYNLINYLIAKLGGNIQHVFFVVSLLTILFMYLSLYEYKDKISVGLGIFVFMLLYYQSSYNGVRQFLAVSLCLFSLKYIFRRKILKFLIMIILAASFHLPSIILLPMYFLYKIIGEKPRWVLQILYYIVLFLIVLNHEIIGLKFLDLFPPLERYRIYLSNKGTFDLGFGIIALNLPYILPGLVFFNKLKQYDNRFTFFFICFNTGLILRFLGYFGNPYIHRISLYFLIVIVILVPYYFRIRKDFALVINYCLILFIIFIWYYEYFFLGYHETIPYNWIF